MEITQRKLGGMVPIQHFLKREMNSISWMLLYERNVGVFQSKVISVSYFHFMIENLISCRCACRVVTTLIRRP